MSHKISVLIRKNSHEVIRVITNHYKKCSKVTAVIVNTTKKAPTKLFFRSFQHTFVIANIVSPPCTPTRRSRTEILWARGTLPHVSPYTTQYLCIHYSKINTAFSQNFSLNHRESTRKHLPCAMQSNKTNYLGRRAKKLYSKNTMFCSDFTIAIYVTCSEMHCFV
jgi:hypothetical protein